MMSLSACWKAANGCIVSVEGPENLPLTRRELLKGIGLIAGGLSLSATGYDHLIPFIHQPEDLVPGVSQWYATSCRECPAGCGMLVRSRESRIVKCEGNPFHPVSLGRLCARGQAAVDRLYDPDRVRGAQQRDATGALHPVAWDNAIASVGAAVKSAAGRVALITDLQTGSMDALMRSWLAGAGSNRLITCEPISYKSVKAAVGGVIPSFKIAESDCLISFAAEFLETWISPIEYAWQFAAMRQITNGTRARFVYVGPRVSATAASADLRIIVPPGTEAAVAYAIASEAGIASAPSGYGVDEVAKRLKIEAVDIRAAARWIKAAKRPLALPGGDSQTAQAAMALNGGGSLVNTTRPHALSGVSSASEMSALIEDMEHGQIEVLLIHAANPVFSLPETSRFVAALKAVKVIVSLSSYYDETSEHANWILPSNHPLESWGDYQPYPDVTNILQPTMATLFDTRPVGYTLFALAEAAGVNVAATFKSGSFYDYLRSRWGTSQAPAAGPDDPAPEWEALVSLGGRWPAASPPSPGVLPMVGVTTSPPQGPSSNYAGIVMTPGHISPTPPGHVRAGVAPPKPDDVLPGSDDELRLWAYPHINFYDGRGANSQLLQEIPEPIVKATWSTWAEIHPDTASRLGIALPTRVPSESMAGPSADNVTVTSGESSIDLPVYVTKGVAPGTVAVPIGQGHTAYGRFAKGYGANVFPLVGASSGSLTVKRTASAPILSLIRGAVFESGRGLAPVTPLGKVVQRDEITMPLPEGYKQRDFYPGHEHDKHRWALVVDMDRCIGCNACVAACYVENNVATVGPRDVRWGREMAWLRIDRYIDWTRKSAPVLFDPMLCQHCDSAPCELVCPVFAAAHSEDGLNMQIYNRCIGTRYCSNNCPYKVRRFNFYGYKWPEPLNWRLNPDVTVRDRGVMEKCTFCIQRIREAEILTRKQGREPRDGEIVTACQQTCPTGVYTFGDLMDPNSKVSKIIGTDPRAFQALHSLNAKPAVIYLKRVVEEV